MHTRDLVYNFLQKRTKVPKIEISDLVNDEKKFCFLGGGKYGTVLGLREHKHLALKVIMFRANSDSEMKTLFPPKKFTVEEDFNKSLPLKRFLQQNNPESIKRGSLTRSEIRRKKASCKEIKRKYVSAENILNEYLLSKEMAKSNVGCEIYSMHIIKLTPWSQDEFFLAIIAMKKYPQTLATYLTKNKKFKKDLQTVSDNVSHLIDTFTAKQFNICLDMKAENTVLDENLVVRLIDWDPFFCHKSNCFSDMEPWNSVVMKIIFASRVATFQNTVLFRKILEMSLFDADVVEKINCIHRCEKMRRQIMHYVRVIDDEGNWSQDHEKYHINFLLLLLQTLYIFTEKKKRFNFFLLL